MSPRSISVLALTALVGCGGGLRAPTEADFQAIARAEARQDAALGRLHQAASPGAAERAAVEACLAADDLCERASRLDDHDARARCRLARRRCRDAHAEAAAREAAP